jgi:hypothetical protein
VHCVVQLRLMVVGVMIGLVEVLGLVGDVVDDVLLGLFLRLRRGGVHVGVVVLLRLGRLDLLHLMLLLLLHLHHLHGHRHWHRVVLVGDGLLGRVVAHRVMPAQLVALLLPAEADQLHSVTLRTKSAHCRIY